MTSSPPHLADASPPPCRLYDVRDACIPYQSAWDWQHTLVSELKASPSAPDALILLEHEPVYTLGTASKLQHVLFPGPALRREDLSSHPPPGVGAALIRTERGGEVTYHGPGQLVAYPILNLHRHKCDLHWYLRSLEEVVIDMLTRHYGLPAGTKQGLTGVFVEEDKICALGLKVSKWVTMHGLAINVDADLGPFERIVPCGVRGYGVTSLARLLGPDAVCMDDARDKFADSFARVFGPIEFVRLERDDAGTAAAAGTFEAQ